MKACFILILFFFTVKLNAQIFYTSPATFSKNETSLFRNYSLAANNMKNRVDCYTQPPEYDKIAPHFLSMPGYFGSEAMMNTTSTACSVGRLNFNCSYYFDLDGQLQDGAITIKKIRKK